MNRRMVLTSVAAAGLFAVIPRASAISTLYAVDKALNVTLNSQRATATPVGSLGRSNVFELGDGESFKDYSFQIYLVPRGSLSDLLGNRNFRKAESVLRCPSHPDRDQPPVILGNCISAAVKETQESRVTY